MQIPEWASHDLEVLRATFVLLEERLESTQWYERIYARPSARIARYR